MLRSDVLLHCAIIYFTIDDTTDSIGYFAGRYGTVVFGKPSVYQERNSHDPVRDIKQKYIGYEKNLTVVRELPHDANAIMKYLPEKSITAFKLYQKHFN